jgi:hypothetical protein
MLAPFETVKGGSISPPAENEQNYKRVPASTSVKADATQSLVHVCHARRQYQAV